MGFKPYTNLVQAENACAKNRKCGGVYDLSCDHAGIFYLCQAGKKLHNSTTHARAPAVLSLLVCRIGRLPPGCRLTPSPCRTGRRPLLRLRGVPPPAPPPPSLSQRPRAYGPRDRWATRCPRAQNTKTHKKPKRNVHWVRNLHNCATAPIFVPAAADARCFPLPVGVPQHPDSARGALSPEELAQQTAEADCELLAAVSAELHQRSNRTAARGFLEASDSFLSLVDWTDSHPELSGRRYVPQQNAGLSHGVATHTRAARTLRESCVSR